MRLFDSVFIVAIVASCTLCTLAVKPQNSTQSSSGKQAATDGDDKNIQKRLGHTETTGHVYREQPVIYQRTMIRNPEDAFTQTIQTNFQCPRGRPGYYADVQNGCKVFHICHEYTMPNGEPHSVRYSQFCPPGTIFDQLTLTCNFEWAAVPCGSANQFYYVNSNLYQPDVHFISDADVQRGRSLHSGQYRSIQSERYYTPARSVSYPPASPPVAYVPRTSSRNYETTSYVSRPAVAYHSRGSGGRVHYDTHTVSRDGGHADVHVERSFVEPRSPQIVRPVSVNERLEVEAPRPQRVVIVPPSHTHAHVHTHRAEAPRVSVHPAQVSFSTYAPHMGFLGFLPIDQHYNVASRNYRYEQQSGPSTYRSYDSRHQKSNAETFSRVDTASEFVPPRYVSEHHRSYQHSHSSNAAPYQRPLIPASEFPGFRQNAYRSSLAIQHTDPNARAHNHHHHHQSANEHHHSHHEQTHLRATPAPTPAPVPAAPVHSLPAVPVVPVTTEQRPAGRTVEVVEEVVLDRARRPASSSINQYDSRHDFGRRIVKHQTETTDFIQEPVVVRGGRKSKTLVFPDEVPYLKRTARSHKEFVEPAFKGASAIPGIIPEEYLTV